MNGVTEGAEGAETAEENERSSSAHSAPSAPTAPSAHSEVAAVREVVLRAHPDAVPELVDGESIAELLASVEPARAAYRRIVEAVAPTVSADPATPVGVVSPPGPPNPPSVPAGAAPALALDPERLPPAEKIRRGLAGRER